MRPSIDSRTKKVKPDFIQDGTKGLMGPTEIDHYSLIRSLSKGGMGEVFLAYDPLCKREVALKQILPRLRKHQIVRRRFVREAEIAAKLSHPSIIPIFTIDPHKDPSYYIMPYIEGETLKQILLTCVAGGSYPALASLPALVRLFLPVCEATSYAHSKGVVHRDLKPDNIIIGRYGQVVLLDWGLADFVGHPELSGNSLEEEMDRDLTSQGKVPGTLNYIAPERLEGAPSHPSMDIYALGVILYQLLTLRTPFNRGSVAEYKKRVGTESYIDPSQRAPHREIPPQLSALVNRCLQREASHRPQSVDALIQELRLFLDGKPEWIAQATLDPLCKEEWSFAEPVLLSKHTAFSSHLTQWMHLMLSQRRFAGQIRLTTCLQGVEPPGVGILLGSPLTSGAVNVDAGLCLWIGAGCQLFYRGVEISSLPEEHLPYGQKRTLQIEIIDNHLSVYLDGQKVCHYASQFPLDVSHIGLLSPDARIPLGPLQIDVRSNQALISCLAVPDAFLQHHWFALAQEEYQKIAHSLSMHPEGREALFKMGCAYLEEARATPSRRDELLSTALRAFDTLRGTPSAPLEYLGKALVYKETGEIDEERKCFDLALRKYPKHPLTSRLIEELLFRLYATSAKERVHAYQFALIALQHCPALFSRPEHTTLCSMLKAPLDVEEGIPLVVTLAFYLGKELSLLEWAEGTPSPLSLHALYGLLHLNRVDWVREIADLPEEIELALLYFKGGHCALFEALPRCACRLARGRLLQFALEKALLSPHKRGIIDIYPQEERSLNNDALLVSLCLWESRLDLAERILARYPQSTPRLCVPRGCYLASTKGKQASLDHFARVQPSLHLSTLLAQTLSGRPLPQLLHWEHIQFLAQSALFAHCLHDEKSTHEALEDIERRLRVTD
jgi:serine/threonine-protein kinase